MLGGLGAWIAERRRPRTTTKRWVRPEAGGEAAEPAPGAVLEGEEGAERPEAREAAVKIENTLMTAVPGFQLKAAEAWTKKPTQVQKTLTGFTALGLQQLIQLNQ